jgi:Fur family ferric uptake transcriptional regulator
MYTINMKDKCCDTNISEKEAKELLAEHGISRTKIKTKILLLLSKAEKPISASELYKKFGQKNCDISTIFRALSQFKEKSLVNELNLGEDFFRYEISNITGHDHHHHHVRCRDCGDIKYLDKCDLSVFEKMISKLGFKNMEHYLEFTGICSKCHYL